MSERLRRWPAKPLLFERVSSNLTVVVFFASSIIFYKAGVLTRHYQPSLFRLSCALTAPLVYFGFLAEDSGKNSPQSKEAETCAPWARRFFGGGLGGY